MAFSWVAYRGGVYLDPRPLPEDGGQNQNQNDYELLTRTGPAHRAATDPTANDDSANTAGNGTFYDLSTWVNTSTWRLWQCLDATPTQARWSLIDTQGDPAAPNQSVQFNDNGNFGGDANLIWNGASLVVGGSVIAIDASLSQRIGFGNYNNAAPSGSQIWSDVAGNLSFFDDVHGSPATLTQLLAQANPGAPVNSVQFNSAGSFGGDAKFTWDGAILTVDGSLVALNASLTENVKFGAWNNATPAGSQIWSDVAGNLSFFDTVTGATKTLSELASQANPSAPVNSVQFNSAGAFGGSSALIWSGTRLELTAVSDNNAIIINGATTGYLRFDTTATGTGNIFSSNAWDLRALNGDVTIQALGGDGNNVTTRCADRAIFQDQAATTRVSIYTTATPAIGRIVIGEDSTSAISMGADNDAKFGFNGANAHYSAPGHHFTNGVGINTAREIYALTIQEMQADRGVILYSADRSENFQWRFNAGGTGFLMGSGPTYFQSSEFVVIRSLSQNIIMQTGANQSFEIRAGTTINFRDFDAGNAVRVSFDTDATPAIGRFSIPENATNSIAIGQGYELTIGYDGNQTAIESHGGTKFQRKTGDNSSTLLNVRDLTSATGDMQRWSHEDTPKARVDHDGVMYASDFRFTSATQLRRILVPMPGPGGQTEASAVEYQPGIIAFVHRKNFDEGLWFTGLLDGEETDISQGLPIFVSWIYGSATADTVEFGIQGAAWGLGDAVPASAIHLSGAQSSAGAGLVNFAEINLPLTGLGADDVVQFNFKIYRNRSGPGDTLNDEVHSLGYFVGSYAFGPAYPVS